MKKAITILLSIISVFYALYLEIFKNQLWGWCIALVLIVTFFVLHQKVLSKQKWQFQLLSFLLLIGLLCCNILISAPKERRVSAGNGQKDGYTDIYTLPQGQLKGINNPAGTVEIFAGIPYAKAPIGDLRWKAPQSAEKWDGVLICDTYAPMAMQQRQNLFVSFVSRIVGYNEIPVSLHDNYLEAMSEDCLYLNIWKPKNANAGDNLPVLFYIHGGSLNSGQSYFDAYNGAALAEQGIIVVNIAYRVGVFGYLADDALIAESSEHTTGNYGLLDQIEALKWVSNNIAAFGGDAGNITIAGESAGASSVNALCVSPLAKGLFKRAIAESSGIVAIKPYHTFRTMEQAKEIATNIKNEFNCSTIDDLRNISAEELVNTRYQNNEMTIDGYAITEQPYLTYLAQNNNEEAVMGGYNGNEAVSFLLFDQKPNLDNYEEFLRKITGIHASEMVAAKPALTNKEAKENFVDLVGMAWFGYSHYTWSNLMVQENRPAYLYFFTKNNKALGDWHSGELPYFYGNLKKNGNYTEEDFALSQTIQSYILNFVKTGNPNGDGLPLWETYNADPNMVMRFDTTVKMEENTYLPVFKVFDAYMNDFK